ncbi:MAG: hypothetical protein GY811_06610 [Myxococcales bacterium]|nr:hypothetical protein [Myxococcales bacterium]
MSSLTNSQTVVYEETSEGDLGRFTGHEAQFSFSAADIDGDGERTSMMLLFEFTSPGHRWLDNVKLVKTADESSVLPNGYIEVGDAESWRFGNGMVVTDSLPPTSIPSEPARPRSTSCNWLWPTRTG